MKYLNFKTPPTFCKDPPQKWGGPCKMWGGLEKIFFARFARTHLDPPTFKTKVTPMLATNIDPKVQMYRPTCNNYKLCDR